MVLRPVAGVGVRLGHKRANIRKGRGKTRPEGGHLHSRSQPCVSALDCQSLAVPVPKPPELLMSANSTGGTLHLFYATK